MTETGGKLEKNWSWLCVGRGTTGERGSLPMQSISSDPQWKEDSGESQRRRTSGILRGGVEQMMLVTRGEAK